ncbi:hypothetical protein NXT3_CH02953 [Sinorhizobium fredii]|uniref:Uncharacterized protein n=1 Tax=Rhizobium fredii TaxID=380 RepID=A0A2L0H7N6_RHIFR|nr:hypothetical protein NXT3_CH02953 [Sinorhizobium fredii]
MRHASALSFTACAASCADHDGIYTPMPALGKAPAATLCQSFYATQNNLLPVEANPATNLPALRLS